MLNYSKANIDSPYSFFSVATSPTGHTTATKALLDSSANRACISLELAHKIGAKIHPAPHTSGTAADGHSIEIIGPTCGTAVTVIHTSAPRGSSGDSLSSKTYLNQ